MNESTTYVYMLRCADGSFYTGLTRRPPEERVGEHDAGAVAGYTRGRRPVTLVWWQEFQLASDAVAAERRIKGWSRRKKISLIKGDWEGIRRAAKKEFRRES
ncbi:MAG: GIY-YIG nuclease family protein [Nitrospinae bacterium]|nr:GIY-YIG nuclease family protein [Nitrospinota bacterium]